MAVTTRRGGYHRCALPIPVDGEVVQCDECHRFWIGRPYPNPPATAVWKPLSRLMAWLMGIR